ncbi:cadherin-like protein 26 [Cheilinus undulatus]|uniref:cadherin-like protein 26 n=1 Tax=Cheilinus undulatus TaxID=241271 RepID=UPI001BD423FE|nr:cadherin-like protein 26 [Cheilinus undulatus]
MVQICARPMPNLSRYPPSCTLHNKFYCPQHLDQPTGPCAPTETDNSQRLLDNDSSQHLKVRERQRFFEEVYQHDMDNYLPSSHLQIDCRKPPMGSISSMEVNVDVLEQMDLMDISDQEALDVFLNSGSGVDDGQLASPLPEGEDEEEEEEDDEDAEVVYRERAPLKRQHEVQRGSRMSSTSSGSSDTSEGGADTPVIQSDDEEVHADTLLLTSVPHTRDEETEEEDEDERCLGTPENQELCALRKGSMPLPMANVMPVAIIALAESRIEYGRRAKRELLLRSKRRWVLSTIELTEEEPGPYPKKISQMFNNMTGDHHEFRISGMGVDQPPLGVFEIDKHTGDVFANRALDREKYPQPFHIKFDIYHKHSGLQLDKELAFDVELKDINDNAPTFDPPRVTQRVKESTRDSDLSVLLYINDIDKDNTPNSQTTVTVVDQNPKQPKIGIRKINDKQFRLTLDGCFDYDKVKKYDIIVKANDHGKPVMSSSATITLNIVDTNTHLPTFKKKEYHGEVQEATIVDELLRIGVEDLDTPKTPGWRAVYYFIKGNEDGNYMIRTDPETNEGILSVVKKKDYEKTMTANLQVGVKNEEPLTICKDHKDGGTADEKNQDSTVITIKVIDLNDPPVFDKDPVHVYEREEEAIGKTLLIPSVYDAEGDKVRFVLLEDPADWVTIDETTGKITSTKKMDRESPHVNQTSNTYTVVIAAIDDGEPSATGTTTVQIHLTDINDNVPQLVSKNVTMCGNKVNKVMVQANDSDVDPYGGPFTFSLMDEDKTLAQRWKVDPATGEEGWLVSLKQLPYGTYEVPLVIQDQQNMIGRDTVAVTVCDCGDKDICKGKAPLVSSIGAPGIGLIFLGLLLFLLLLLLFMCQCGKKEFKIPITEDEGNQTLIKYNQEGGGSECKSVPSLPLTPTRIDTVTDSIKVGTKQVTKTAPVMNQEMDAYSSYSHTMINSHMNSMSMQHQRDTMRSQGAQNMYSMWNTSRTNTYQGGSSRYNRSLSLRSTLHIADHLDRRLHTIDGNHTDYPVYRPCEYAYEGQGSRSQSLDRLSLSNYGDDLNFLNELGPKFKTLGSVLQQKIQEKKTGF